MRESEVQIIRLITPISADISTSPARDAAALRPHWHFLCLTLCVAALANALVPAVFFSETRLFGQTDPHDRALVAAVVVAEYAIALLLILLHANVGFASGYTVATAAIVTIGSAVLTFLIVNLASFDWNALYAEILGLGGFAFAIFSNAVFLVASIRYARAIHPRLHLGGFFLGIAASIALVVFYARIVP